MGRYFVRRFLEDGHTVVGHDLAKHKQPPKGLAVAPSNAEAVRGADVVLLSVPVEETPEVGREAASRMRQGSVIIEIASVKTPVRGGLMRAIKGKRVELLSVHPMFGPRSTATHPTMLVLGGSASRARAKVIFPWAELIPVSEGDHDIMMAYALSLVHAVNIAFASAVSKRVGVALFRKVSSPLGRAQLTLAQAVLSQDPALYSLIQTENPHSPDAISTIIAELRGLQRLVEGKSRKEFERRFAGIAGKFSRRDLEEALDRVYSLSG